MKKKKLLVLAALIAVFALTFCACGSKTEPTQPTQTAAQTNVPAQPLGLASWEMTAATWSSPNGATVILSAVPTSHTDGDSALFTVRMEGEEVASVACEYKDGCYTGSLDLNAADGYCYFVILTGADGTSTEVAVNTPTAPTDEALINMESSLNSYCSLMVSDFVFDGKWLTVTGGQLQVQPPRITNAGETITCAEATLVLSLNGEQIGTVQLALPEDADDGSIDMPLTGAAFQVPELEDDQQLTLQLDAKLSNGQVLTAPGGSWTCNDGELLLIAG